MLVNHLPLQSGYDILDRDKAYDLIFLDPYGDFWGMHQEVIQKIHHKVSDSSVLLFASLERERHWGQLIDLVRKRGMAYAEGAVKGKGAELDGRYYQGVIFFPSLNLSRGDLGDLVQNLQHITAMINRAIHPGS